MVEAGDVLYIPQTWIHWGEATGDSTSVTLVVNSRTFHLDFAASLPDALRRLPGWARSLPVGPGSRAARARALGDLVRATFTPAAAARVHPHLHDRRAPPPLAADMDRVRAFVATAPAPPTAGFVLPADDVDTPRALRALLARRTLRRLLLAVAKRAASTRGATDRILYQQCVAALQVQDDAALERLGNEPELVGLAATAADGLPRHEDPLAAELARALVPELIAGGDETVAFALLPDVGGGFTVRRAGLRLVLDDPPEALVARVVAGELQVFVDGRFRRPDDAPGVRVAALPRLRGVGPHLAPGPTTWAARNIRDQEVTAADPAAFARFCAAMESGAAQLAAAWPAAWREVADGVRWLLPLSDRGRAPHNYSVHALRGMIASSPRDGHRCAQTLAHEAGHNRLSTILDLFELCADPARVVHSPVVAAPRPLSFVFHGCYAFAQDIALTERLLPGAPADARPSLQRYLDECRAKAGAALDVLTREAELTRVGATVVAEVAGVLGR
jgi:HEXXH motif-containing protein